VSRIVKGKNPFVVLLVGSALFVGLVVAAPVLVAVAAVKSSHTKPGKPAPPRQPHHRRGIAAVAAGTALALGGGVAAWSMLSDGEDAGAAVTASTVVDSTSAGTEPTARTEVPTTRTSAPAAAPTTATPVSETATTPPSILPPPTVVPPTTAAPAPMAVAPSFPAGVVAAAGTEHLSGPYHVVQVVDGDTVRLQDGSGAAFLVNLIGIDSPDVDILGRPLQCFGAEAAGALRFLTTAAGGTVYVETDPSLAAVDGSGRPLGYLWTAAGLDLGRHLVEQGYAVEHAEAGPYAHEAVYRTGQADADAHDRGLWAASTCGGKADLPIAPAK
jgi:endonuclease YncB( thermonuclease family)